MMRAKKEARQLAAAEAGEGEEGEVCGMCHGSGEGGT